MLSTVSYRRAISHWYPLLLISSTSLFLEMAVIRWISSEVRLLAYFKNLSLLAAFLGLAIGFGLAGRNRDYRPTFAPLLGIFLGIGLLVGRLTSPRPLPYPGISDEVLWGAGRLMYAGNLSYIGDLALFAVVLLVFFLLIMFLFIPLGQATGQEMERHDPVPAYIANLLGSLAGIWCFALLSYLQMPPAAWFGTGMLGVGVYLTTRRVLSRSTLIGFVLMFAGLLIVDSGTTWSPYHRLNAWELTAQRKSDGSVARLGYALNVQQITYQTAEDFSEEAVASLGKDVPRLEQAAFMYNLPYRLGREGAEVLVVGAGMGNDVAAALRNGASLVDAVEIDPAIVKLGRDLHPEAPYRDPRVTTIVDDARSFFEKNPKRYDVIAFGLLDSHTMLSSMTNVRLESFVYTLDSFEQMRDHLKENGLVSVTFWVTAPWIEERLGRILVQLFGSEKVFVHYGPLGTTFLAGSVPSEHLARYTLDVWQPDPAVGDIPLATDDWPYLYLRNRKVPPVYWQTLLIVAVVCVAMIGRYFPEALRPNWHFWFLGAAFLLIEFKAITELALLFGSTWVVNVLAVSGVLVMALGANLLVLQRRSPLKLRLVYVLLFASLGLNYFFPLDLLLGLPAAVRALVAMLLLSMPLFFSGLIFSESLRRARESARPMASNLTGSVAGGVLEYGALLWGVKSLYIIAAILYGGALLAFLRQRR